MFGNYHPLSGDGNPTFSDCRRKFGDYIPTSGDRNPLSGDYIPPFGDFYVEICGQKVIQLKIITIKASGKPDNNRPHHRGKLLSQWYRRNWDKVD